ncbi:MAG: Hsp20/alpha crystallin family protein [Xanthobacteraceae bacterium]
MTLSNPGPWTWNEALSMLERAEQLHRRFFEPVPSAATGACWDPPIDMFESERELCLIAALPGVEAADLNVSIEGDLLCIAGHRRLPSAVRRAAIHRLEIPHGRFERRVRLPAYRLTLGRSELTLGCLVIHLVKD